MNDLKGYLALKTELGLLEDLIFQKEREITDLRESIRDLYSDLREVQNKIKKMEEETAKAKADA